MQEVIAAAQAAAEADPANAQMYVTDDFCSGFVRMAQPDPTLTCAICMESLTAAYYSLGCSSTRSEYRDGAWRQQEGGAALRCAGGMCVRCCNTFFLRAFRHDGPYTRQPCPTCHL